MKDLKLMAAFYQRCFGLSMVDCDAGDFCVLGSDDWGLSLVSVPAATAASVVITSPPRRRKESPLKLAFEVASIEDVHAVVTGSGGQVDPIETAWVFRGHRHLDCLDPEGNVVQLRQRVI